MILDLDNLPNIMPGGSRLAPSKRKFNIEPPVKHSQRFKGTPSRSGSVKRLIIPEGHLWG